MSSTTLPVCPKTGSISPSLTVHLCLHTAPGNRECAPEGCLDRIGPEREPWALTTDEVRDWLAKSREMKGLETDEALPLEVKPVGRYRR